MGTRNTRIRIAVAAAGLVAAGAILLYARSVAKGLPLGPAEALDGASDGLVIATALYAVNWVIAWVYRRSWPVTLARSLVFAVVAYVGLSNAVDVFGEHRELAWQICGLAPVADHVLVAGLRAEAMCALGVLGLSAIAISLGFEPRTA
jgi:hypothetical protein